MSVYTASFRRFHRSHTYSREELALIEALERQRHLTGRVRYVIDSPADRYTAVLQAYIAYIQHLDRRDAIVLMERRRPASEWKHRALTLTPRTYLRALGTPRCIGQILLLDAHAYCPSIPLYRSRLDAILSLLIQYVSGPNSVIIIQGTTHTQKNTRFRHHLKQASQPASIYEIWDAHTSMERRRPASEPKPCRSVGPKVRPILPLGGETPPIHKVIPIFRPAQLQRCAPLKIAA